MTNRERFVKFLRGQEVDRPVYWFGGPRKSTFNAWRQRGRSSLGSSGSCRSNRSAILFSGGSINAMTSTTKMPGKMKSTNGKMSFTAVFAAFSSAN